jgi:hypothetical protein
MEDRFKCDEFDKFYEHVHKYWKPNCELAIKVTDWAKIYNWLCNWFEFLEHPETNKNITGELKINIGPFINIIPYGKFDLGINKDGDHLWEFLFISEDINKTKLTKNFLTI